MTKDVITAEELQEIFNKEIDKIKEIDPSIPAEEYKTIDLANRQAIKLISGILNGVARLSGEIKKEVKSFK